MLNKAQMNCKTEEHGLTTNVKGLNASFDWKEKGIPFGEWLDPVCEWVFFAEIGLYLFILSDPCLTLIRLCFSFPYRFCSWFPRSVSIPSMLSPLLKLFDTSLTAFSFGIFWIFKLNLTYLMMPNAFQKKLKLLAHVITLLLCFHKLLIDISRGGSAH